MKSDHDGLQKKVLGPNTKAGIEGLSPDQSMLVELAELNMYRLKVALYGEGTTGEEALQRYPQTLSHVKNADEARPLRMAWRV